jgi:hypothetical protein
MEGPQVYFSRDGVHVVGANGATLRMVTDHGLMKEVTITSEDWTSPMTVESLYVRAEVRDRNGDMLALSNPLWAE